ncbi:TLP18.3, Psb32 and MOLO-1 founding protein of phosphatase [Pseudarcicella hirudinis]|uniref:TLP18.3, Psb32 and MOLO-1 founding protein of phosphatase n=1 Tax=Pseudarcicella hirudinis TaxID=1079859 RepID=A0A1I5UHD6_9BACT|nr:TPM domain-containing protein [Pseudarcicella hirudinis]SFP94672.1 TLP18.3, Psb32 and MOLO-1 founding protein of phosphatase [Pseudarcicella hirudinis]
MSQNFFTEAQKAQIISAIKSAELNTSGEIKVHIEAGSGLNPMDRAIEVFSMLEMHKTEQENAVLFYLAVSDRKFAILGDKGIDKVVPENFWESVKELLKSYFVRNEYADGLVAGIHLAGEQLKKYFPYQSDDINEISDDISFGN